MNRSTARHNHARLTAAMLAVIGVAAGLVTVAAQAALYGLDHGLALTTIQVPLLFSLMWFHGLVAAIALAALVLVRRRQALPGLVPRILIPIMMVLFLASLDQVVGFFFPPPDVNDFARQPHATRGWSYRANAVGLEAGMLIHVNSLGLRDEQFSKVKPAGERRILCVGDSVTFGWGLEPKDTYPARLNKLLNDQFPARDIRVINAGFGGYSTWQEADYLETDGLALSPDLVLLGLCVNDLFDLVGMSEHARVAKLNSLVFPPLNHPSGLVRMVAHYYDQSRIRKIRETTLWASFDTRPIHMFEPADLDVMLRDPLPPEILTAWRRLTDDLARFDESCRRHKTTWVIVGFPVRSRCPPDDALKKLSEMVQEWADSHGVPYLDTAPRFAAKILDGAATPAELFQDEIHLQPAGCQFVAAAIADFLDERSFLPPSPATMPSSPGD